MTSTDGSGGHDDSQSSPWAAPTGPPAAPLPPTPSSSGRRRAPIAIALVVALALVAAVVAVVATQGGDGDEKVQIAGADVVDSAGVIADASDRFRALAEDAGAATNGDTGCFWEQVEFDGATETIGVICGPARFVFDGDWVTVPIDPTPVAEGEVEVTISFERAGFTSFPAGGSYVGVDGAVPNSGAELGQPSREGRVFTAEGQMLTDADELLAAGRAALDTLGTGTVGEPVNRHPDAGCWLPQEADADGLQNLVCGPVLTLSDDATKPWRAVSWSAVQGEALWLATFDPASVFVGEQISLPGGIALYGADGAQPPDTTGFGLPDPPAQTAEYVEIVPAADMAELELTPPAVTDIVMPDFTFRVEGIGTADRVGTGSEALLPAAGEHFVAARYRWDFRESTIYEVDDTTTAVLVVDGVRRPLDVDFDYADGESFVVLASVPAGAKQVDLEVQTRGKAQAISLLTGEQTLSIPGLDRSGAEQGVNSSFTTSATGTRADGSTFTVNMHGTVTRATLQAWDSDRAWAPDGKLYLYVELGDPTFDYANCDQCFGQDEVSWGRSVSLTLPDGTVLAPAALDPGELSEDAPEGLHFEVPADLTTATLSISFAGRTHEGYTTEIAAVPNADPFTVPVTF